MSTGWAFPVQPTSPLGAVPTCSGAALVRQAVRLVLVTEPGERIMRPSFGCGLRQFLMAPNTPGTRAAIAEAVTTALTTWESRISLRGVEVVAGEDPSVAVVTVSYVHNRDGSADVLRLGVAVGGL